MRNSTPLVVAGSVFALAISFSTLLVPSLAFAQPDPDTIGVFADPFGTIGTLDFVGGGEASFYVVAFDPQPFDNYEFSIGMPSDFVVIDVDWLSADGSEATVTGDIRNARVAAGGCLDGEGAVVLAVVTVVTFAAVGIDTPVCVGPAEPTRFPDDPVPGYEACTGELHPLDLHQCTNYMCIRTPPGCLILNWTGTVALESPSFGGIKARY